MYYSMHQMFIKNQSMRKAEKRAANFNAEKYKKIKTIHVKILQYYFNCLDPILIKKINN